MNKVADLIVTTFDNVFSKSGHDESLRSILEEIKIGRWKNEISRCRGELSAGNTNGYNKVKSLLPATAFCGTFNRGHRVQDLVVYNKLLVIDVDKIPLEALPETQSLLCNDSYLYSVWLSPSGSGLKGLVRLESPVQYHKLAFDQVASYFLEKYDVRLDKSGSDVSRLCYASWDPNLFINENSSVFTLNENLLITNSSHTNTNMSKQRGSVTVDQVVGNQKALYFKTEGRNKVNDRASIQSIIKFLSKKKLSITRSHSDWLRVGLAIAATFTFDIGEEYFLRLCRLDREEHNEPKSKDLIDYCYRNRNPNGPTMATIKFLAAQKGFMH